MLVAELLNDLEAGDLSKEPVDSESNRKLPPGDGDIFPLPIFYDNVESMKYSLYPKNLFENSFRTSMLGEFI